MPHDDDNFRFPDGHTAREIDAAGEDLTHEDRAAAGRVRAAMPSAGLDADLRARLLAGAAASMHQNRETHAARRFRPRPIWNPLWTISARRAPWAAAAVLLLAVSVVLLLQRPSPAPQPRTTSLDPMDTNADGVLDILDARALAVAVAAGETDPSEDLNHDGVVSLADADAIARRVVRLGASG